MASVDDAPPLARTRPASSLDLLRWSDAPSSQNVPPVRVSATNDSSAFVNASIELQPPEMPPPRFSATNDSSAFVNASIESRPPELVPPRVSATNDSSAFVNASRETQPPEKSLPNRFTLRPNQPAGGVSSIAFGSNLSLEESETSQRRKTGSDHKRREMTGNGIFNLEATPESQDALPSNKSLQPAGETAVGLSPKKPGSAAEAAKQRELCGTRFEAADESSVVKRPCSSAKSKELEGSNIFGKSRNSLYSGNERELEENRAPRTSVKVSNPAGGRSQISFGCEERSSGEQQQFRRLGHNRKVAELSGSNIFKDELPSSYDKNVSAAKRREMLGNDIFSDGAPFCNARDRGGVRQPPGGESNLKLY